MAKAKHAVPAGHGTVTAMVGFDDAKAAADWYKKALGAEELSRSPGPDGKIMHGELKIGDTRIMFHDAMMGQKGARTLGGGPVGFWIYVDDADALFKRAISAGGVEVWPMADQFWGDRCGSFKDPEGLQWTIATRKEDLTPEEMMQRQKEFFAKMAADKKS